MRLHYVIGAKGAARPAAGSSRDLWGYNKIMPALAKRYRVIVVDIRGMGSSDKPMHDLMNRGVAAGYCNADLSSLID